MDVGVFLRSMRARQKPDDGAAAGKRRRRTPGLRREEVAERAGVSVDWYVRLEQGRADRPSVAVLDAVSRALALSAAERRYLFRIARGEEPSRVVAGEAVHPSLSAALALLTSQPAIVLGPRFDILASNRAGAALFLGFGEGPFGRNAVHFTMCDPRAKALFPDHKKVARDSVGALRSAFARRPLDASFLALVAELSARSPAFVALWGEQHVADKGLGRKRFRHPEAGTMDLEVHSLAAPYAEGQLLLFYLGHDETSRANAERLVALADDPVRPRSAARGPSRPRRARTTVVAGRGSS